MTFDPGSDPNNVTTAAIGDPAPATLADLKADPIHGDGNYANNPFVPGLDSWKYVLLLDGTQAFYDGAAEVWVEGATPPVLPYSGEVIADLTTLRTLIGAPTSSDDANLERALAAATEWVYERSMRCDWDHPDVQYAALLLATRLYQRRKTPEGVAGFAGDGVVVRVIASDPDIARLLERHLELRTIGVG